MKIALIGGAGAMARTTILDLLDNPEVEEILVADYQADKAAAYVAALGDPRLRSCFVDGFDTDRTAETIKDYDAVINAAQLYPGLFESIMTACLRAGCHYNDLGGMFWTSQKLLARHDEFEQAGLTAVLCIGSAPGLTNILGRYACDRLDTVDEVHFWDASTDLTDRRGLEVFLPPYSIRTIMQEFSDPPVQYLEGEYVELAPLSGAAEATFPDPIGKRVCVHTLHSEPATFVPAFKHKGLRTCTWRLGLPPDFDEKARFLASIGFASLDPLRVGQVEAAPREVLAAVVEKHLAERLAGVNFDLDDVECLRAQALGRRGGKRVEYVVDCVARNHRRWGVSAGDLCTGAPPSMAAQMQAKGLIPRPGVFGPEIIDPEYFFRELAQREMKVQVTVREDLN
ncbi:MAG: saccharopine dehydrogenase NADP-binding domain-containing protein [Thermodesulfobacteriota bacterium]